MNTIHGLRPSPRALSATRRLCLWLAPLGLGLAATQVPAQAEEAAAADSASDIQEVVVTATRRNESLSKVPISITAITKEDLDLKGVKDIQDVARFTPGINVDRSGTSNISIRGIASSGGAGTTGIYIDDTPIQIRALAFDPDEAVPKSFDIERVEVLRGPQGTLFGAGSEGGTVRYITTQPSLTQQSVYGRAEVSTTRGGDLSYEAGVAAGGPIVDGTFGGRVAVWYRKDGGFVDRVDPTAANPEAAVVEKNANSGESLMVRVAGLWAPNDRWSITPAITYQDRKLNDVSNYWAIYSHGGQFVSGNPQRNPTPDKFYLPSLKVEGKFDKVTLISNTSYYHRDETSGYDGTLYNLGFYQTFAVSDPPTPFAPGVAFPLLDGTGLHLPAGISNYRSPGTVDNGQINFTQEVRLQSNDDAARLKWTAGAFYTKNRQRYLEQIHDPMLEQFTQSVFGLSIEDVFGIGYDPAFPTDSYYLLTQAQDEQFAGFGEGTFEFTDRLKLTLGARYSDMKYSFTTVTGGPQLFGPTDPPTNGSISETAFTPKATIAFQATPQHMFYGTYAKGFRPGGANNPLPQVACQQDFDNFGITAAPTTYKSDSTDSFEVGAKDNFDNRFRIASSVFYIKWKNIQQTVVPPICQISYIDNLGDAVAQGVDFQADLKIVDDLTAQLSAGYTDARYTSVKPLIPVIAVNDAISGTGGFSGQTPAPLTVALGLEYKFSAMGHESFVRGDFDYHKKANWLPASQDPSTLQYDSANFTVPGTTFLTMRAGMKLGDWSAELFCDNCTDNATITGYDHSIDPGTGDSRLFRALTFRPLTIGLTFIYRH